jgi:hypothetical protein
MYDLNNVAKDFPWTAVTYNAIEPWREKGTNWFDELPKGWGDVCYKWLIKLTKFLEENDLMRYIVIEQVKEKWGGLRFYYIFTEWPHDTSFETFLNSNVDSLSSQEGRREKTKEFDDMVAQFEEETKKVCCDCGTTTNIKCYGGWVHFACPECEEERKRIFEEEYKKWKERNERVEQNDREEY